jgi:Ca-activated chloride channel family protein
MKRLLFSTLILLGASPLFAQNVPPALMVQVKDRSEPLRMSKIQSEVRIVGYVAETVTTMTFANPYDRVLQGDLYFPLPSGSTISGYALDINGKMIDGVAVEKHKGREVFEKIVRQNVDPGLIEWTKGNNFKTRVFPIPARGNRTIRVEYVTELAGEADDPAYHLPLNFSRPVDDFSLRVEVVKQVVAPRVAQGGLPNFDFKRWRESYVAETRLTDVTLTEDLLVAVPNVEKQRVVVERTPAGDCYFAIHDLPAVPDSPGLAPRPPVSRCWWIWSYCGTS